MPPKKEVLPPKEAATFRQILVYLQFHRSSTLYMTNILVFFRETTNQSSTKKALKHANKYSKNILNMARQPP
jgi:hypothetical protein